MSASNTLPPARIDFLPIYTIGYIGALPGQPPSRVYLHRTSGWTTDPAEAWRTHYLGYATDRLTLLEQDERVEYYLFEIGGQV